MRILKTLQVIVLPGILIVQLNGCSTRHSEYTHWDDAAPTHQVDITKVENAKPMREPRSRFGNPKSYVVNGQRYYVLPSSDNYLEQGIASWYGTQFHGKRTSSGEPYNMYAMTAAHKSLPLPTYVKVTNLDNNRTITVKVNDRGPFIKGRIIDLSYVAAQKLGITVKGTGHVEVKAINTHSVEQTPAPVIKKEPVIYPEIADTSKNLSSNLYLQVGIFNDKKNAESFRSKLNHLPLPTIKVTTDRSGEVARYRVRIGPLSNDAEADQLIEMLARNGHTGFRIRVD